MCFFPNCNFPNCIFLNCIFLNCIFRRVSVYLFKTLDSCLCRICLSLPKRALCWRSLHQARRPGLPVSQQHQQGRGGGKLLLRSLRRGYDLWCWVKHLAKTPPTLPCRRLWHWSWWVVKSQVKIDTFHHRCSHLAKLPWRISWQTWQDRYHKSGSWFRNKPGVRLLWHSTVWCHQLSVRLCHNHGWGQDKPAGQGKNLWFIFSKIKSQGPFWN